MWAICRAALTRASTKGENADDVYSVLEFLLMHGSRADQRYFGTEKENYQTPLMLMALSGAVDCVRLLIKFGASVATCDSNGWTALHVACAPNSPRKAAAATPEEAYNDEMVDLLIEAKGNVHVQNSAGLTPLHCACHGGDVPSAALLILAGSKLNARSGHGFSPIIWALIGAEGNDKHEMVQLLLDSCQPDDEEGDGADDNAVAETEDEKATKAEQAILKAKYKEQCLVEYVEDMKCFKLAHLIVQLKMHLREYLLAYAKTAKEKMG
ncbi:ANK2, partial [Symbiodinium microadriaticum]